MNTQTLKGFRDFLPKEVLKRQYVLGVLKKVFESYGFEPLETPALEYEEILTGKYGEEGDKLMYRFEDLGGRKVAMRYDQTVPLARVIAQYQNEIPLPLKRYQIQSVWRAENTQKGRYREFLQVDADIVGVYSPLADAEIINLALDCVTKLGFNSKNIILFINDRKIFQTVEPKFISTIDKLEKIGKDGVLKELVDKGLSEGSAEELLSKIENSEITNSLNEIFNTLKLMLKTGIQVEFKPTLARGLDYYTGAIFELVVQGPELGSIGGGGRYDKLIGIFSGKDIPAVGFSFGFDRLIEAMESMNLFPKNLNGNEVLIAFADSELQEKALEVSINLRNKNLNVQFYLEDAPLEKQLKYADKKQIPFCLIVNKDNFILRNMQSGQQKKETLEKIINELAQS